jgi:F-type H+-transporting ATPase subunit b
MLKASLVLVALSAAGWAGPVPAGSDDGTTSPESAHAAADVEQAHGEAAHGGAHHDPYDLSSANPGETQGSLFELRADLAIATLAVFMLLLAVLYKFAWGPIAEALDRREQGIAQQLDEARRNQEQARELLEQHEAKLAAATAEVRDILDGARRDAEVQRQTIVAEAEEAARAEKDRAIREISAAKNEALQTLAQTSVDHAIGLAGQILGKELKKEDHQQLIESAVSHFPSDV